MKRLKHVIDTVANASRHNWEFLTHVNKTICDQGFPCFSPHY